MASTTVSRFRELGKKIVAVGRNYKYDAFLKHFLSFFFLHLNTRPPPGHNLACLESRIRSEKSSVLRFKLTSTCSKFFNERTLAEGCPVVE